MQRLKKVEDPHRKISSRLTTLTRENLVTTKLRPDRQTRMLNLKLIMPCGPRLASLFINDRTLTSRPLTSNMGTNQSPTSIRSRIISLTTAAKVVQHKQKSANIFTST